MAHNITQEERQLLKIIEKLPVTEEEKNAWNERIHGGEMSNELAEEIRQKLTTPVEGADNLNQTRHLTELANVVRRWRLASQSRNFAKH
jgi:hypothetical protein